MSDTAKVFGTTYTGVTALKVSDGNSGTLTYIHPTGMKSITANGIGIDVSNYATVDVNVSGGNVTISQDANGYIVVDSAAPSGGIDYLAAYLNGTLTSYSSTTVTSLYQDAFRENSVLTSVNFPNCTSINNTAFYNCQNLGPTLTFPSLVSIGTSNANGYEFEKCYALTGIDVGNSNTNITRFGATATFERCTNLTTIIIRSPNVAPIQNNTFANGGFPSGTLYVPSSLVNSYKNATNWSSHITNNSITVTAIEGSVYENVHLDSTPV